MRRLILVRHAKSSWDDPGAQDHERLLAARGKRDAPKMAARLAERYPSPDLILSSNAVRARETARIVAESFAYPTSSIRLDERIYLASPRTLMSIVAEQDAAIASLALVGHNPGFTDLANSLTPDLALDNLPTSGIVVIGFRLDDWADIEPDAGQLEYLDYPKNRQPPLVQ
jgi:phosphohistidine phosphatase